MKGIILDGHDGATNASTGNHLVSRFQLLQHLLPLLLAPLLRHDQEKIEDGKNEDERSKAQPSHGTAAGL